MEVFDSFFWICYVVFNDIEGFVEGIYFEVNFVVEFEVVNDIFFVVIEDIFIVGVVDVEYGIVLFS